jgi:hypothetical protein
MLLTMREFQRYFGLIRYWRLWIDTYTLRTKAYSQLLEEGPDTLIWKPEEILMIEELKHSLVTTPLFGLTSLKKPFCLFVNVDKGTALGVLTQEYGEKKQPIASLSKIRDPVT